MSQPALNRRNTASFRGMPGHIIYGTWAGYGFKSYRRDQCQCPPAKHRDPPAKHTFMIQTRSHVEFRQQTYSHSTPKILTAAPGEYGLLAAKARTNKANERPSMQHLVAPHICTIKNTCTILVYCTGILYWYTILYWYCTVIARTLHSAALGTASFYP